MKYLISCVAVLFTLLPCVAYSQEPALLFSDITSGPKSGIGDDLGEGAIVTIWGTGLKSTQGFSKVYCGGVEASHIYYWENADPENGNSGPADLYSYHKMQEIAFSIDSNASVGLTSIYVIVDGKQSNSLEFTIRSGDIYFVKTTGNNGNNGSWSSPWLTVDYACSGVTAVNAGDIVYVCDGINDTSTFVIGSGGEIDGTVSNPIALVAYPGATVVAEDTAYQTFMGGINNWYDRNDYWTFSKLKLRSDGRGISCFRGMRVVGCEITDIDCADGASGAISGAGSTADGGIKCLGNYIHDFGCEGSWSWHHVFYISNRSGRPIMAFELGWNFLKDNNVNGGLHVYDEGNCGDWTGTVKIHDNVVVNQSGPAFDFTSAGCNAGSYVTAPVWVYNNLFINSGLTGGGASTYYSVMIAGSSLISDIKYFNNIIYGYGNTSGGAINVTHAGSWECKNNIFYDTKNLSYIGTTTISPTISNNNIWYNGGDTFPSRAPSWDTAWDRQIDNPEFNDPGYGDFRLRPNSPCIENGSDLVSNVVQTDIMGIKRGNSYETGSRYDIGAFEWVDTGDIDYPPNVSIAFPTSATTYITSTNDIDIGGSASDDQSVSMVSWSNNRGGSGTATNNSGNWSTWSVSGISLQEGENLIIVTAQDNTGKTRNDTLTVSYVIPGEPDTQNPTISINGPSSSYTPTINVSGTASDNVLVASVAWNNDRSGEGTATNDSGDWSVWSIDNITLEEGFNTITVTAQDTSGNSGIDTLTVEYTIPSGTFTEAFGDRSGSDYPETVEDTFINVNSEVNASGMTLNTYTWPENMVANAIILKWDLSAMPSSAVIHSAYLTLFLEETSGDSIYTLSAHQILNHNPVINLCDGYTYDGTNGWTPNSECYANIPLAQGDIAEPTDTRDIDAAIGDKTWDITQMVQYWVSNPSINFGVLINSDNNATSTSSRIFSSSESSNPRPMLTVQYSVGDAAGVWQIAPPKLSIKPNTNLP